VKIVFIVRLLASCAKSGALLVQVFSFKQRHPIKLPGANSLGIKDYKGVACYASEAVSIRSFALSLDVDLAMLPYNTIFEKLCDKYSGWSKTKTRVKWNAIEHYILLDFLPPIIQTVSGKYWRTTRHEKLLPNLQNRLNLTYVLNACNC
jgi:hypothetical protein